MVEIELTQDQITHIDDRDVELIEEFKWFACRYRHMFYAKANTQDGPIYMHRLLTGFPNGVVDHKDRDGLNNLSDNLRVVSYLENNMNRRGRLNGSSRYKGVSKKREKWTASISVSGKKIHLGTFEKEEEAALAYDDAVLQEYGEIAWRNF